MNYYELRGYNYYKRDTKCVKSLPSYGALCLIIAPVQQVLKTDVIASEFLEYQAPNKRRLIRSLKVLGLNFDDKILGSFSHYFIFLELNQDFFLWKKMFYYLTKFTCEEFQGRSIGRFTKVWVRVKLLYFEYEFYICLQISQKR